MQAWIGANAPGSASRLRRGLGWAAVGLNLATASLWAFWGAIEAFHEGWWHPALSDNLLGALRYMTPATIFVAIGSAGVLWPRVGAVVVLAFTAWVWWWWDVPGRISAGGTQAVLGLVMGGVGGFFAVLWWFGRAVPRRWALRATVGVPLAVAVASGAWPGYLAATRVNDGDFGEREVAGNGVVLRWAPRGPGWPRRGSNWEQANEAAVYLSEDGLALKAEPQGFWRLPRREELVRSLVRRGENAGGVFDEAVGGATYRRQPNKDTPLWDPHSEIIYWWTSDEGEDGHAWTVAYNGTLTLRNKRSGMGTLAFRLVRVER